MSVQGNNENMPNGQLVQVDDIVQLENWAKDTLFKKVKLFYHKEVDLQVNGKLFKESVSDKRVKLQGLKIETDGAAGERNKQYSQLYLQSLW